MLEKCLASLDNGKHCVTFASGLGATTTIISLLNAGDHLIVTDDLYGGTSRYLRLVASRMNIQAEFVDATDPDAVSKAIKPNTKLVWLETPTNPSMKVVDIEAISKLVHKTPGVSYSC